MSNTPLGPAPSPASAQEPSPPPAWVYLLRCPDDSLYCGWTNNLPKRLKAHRGGKAGAKYTKSHGAAAVRLAYAACCADKSAALRREREIKRLSKPEKEALAAGWAKAYTVTLRPAVPEDAAAILAIYRWYVTHSTRTFQYQIPTEEDYRAMIAATWRKAPFLVAQGGDGRVLGYAYAHLWHEREAYSWDVETSVYCAQDAVGQGVGRRLYRALLALVTAQGYHNAFALITSPNPESEAFHRAMGFVKFGTERHTGYKFGQWLSLGYWQRPLGPVCEDAPAPVRLTLPEAELKEILANENR